jgi:hypothetical protein
MKKTLLLTLALMLPVSMAAGQAGYIGIFSDPFGTDCELDATVTGIPDDLGGQQGSPSSSVAVTQYYIVHLNAVRAMEVRFAAPKPACMAAHWLQDASVYVYTGNSQTGIQMGYGTCQTGTFHILTISYVVDGLTPECCLYPVVADPGVSSGKIEVVDCDSHLSYGTGSYGIINANSTCDCNIPIADATWGRVKALYGE